MITEIPVGYSVEVDDYKFTLQNLYITVEQNGTLLKIIPVLNSDGIRIVRTQEEFETEVAFWLGEYT